MLPGFHGQSCGYLPWGYLNPITYKTLMQAFVDHIIQHMNKKPIAAIINPMNEDIAFTSAAPIAVVMGSSSTPVAYMSLNTSNVVEEDTYDSDDSVSPPAVASVSFGIALILMPHVYWNCTTNGSTDSFPLMIHVLIDNGSHIVSISNNLVTKLYLKCQTICKPMSVELAIPDMMLCLT